MESDFRKASDSYEKEDKTEDGDEPEGSNA